MVFKKIREHPAARERILRERLTEPLHLNLASLCVAGFGTFRAKVACDLIYRPHYAYGLLSAADQALESGVKEFTAVEFGVAAGEGLLNLCELSRRIQRATGVRIKVVGFDSGAGMPVAQDYRDHPEEFQSGDFPMDHEKLISRLPDNCELILGPVRETVPAFVQESMTSDTPLGFASFDLDYYTSTKEAFSLLTSSDAAKYLFLPILYFDDIVLPNYNNWAGELLAINEFNAEHEYRKIEQYRFLRSRRIFRNARWLDQIFLLHVFDHPRMKMSHTMRRMPNVYF